MIGESLGHYEVMERLGAGGMGEVYLAQDTRLERKVALKVLPADLADDPERLIRLVREAKALAALDHPHIVTVFSVEEDRGIHFLTMAHVTGQTLDSLIPRNGLSLERLLELALPLADALRAAHEQGIIHRDLKPSNVMVDREGRLRVLDFGLAKRDAAWGGAISQASTRQMTEPMTRKGAVLGTYPYMSPEQAQGKSVDSRSDLFSLGVVLYEMACGERPFQGDNGLELLTSILRDKPRSIHLVRPDLPVRLGEIVDRCLEKDLRARYVTAEEVRRDLEELQLDRDRGAALAVVDEPLGERSATVTSRRLRMSRFAVLAVLAIVALLSVAVVWRVGRTLRTDEAVASPAAAAAISSIAVMPLRNGAGDPAQEFFVDGMTEALITDLSKISALKVISWSSTARYKGTDKTAAEIAGELGVEAIVKGSVLREGNRVGIRAELIKAADKSNLWADRYERELTSVLTIQGEIAQAIARKIQIALTPAEEGRLAGPRDVDPAALEAYLKGRFHLQRFTPQDFSTALEYFDAAVDIDPEYALAYVGKGNVWMYRNQYGLLPPSEAEPRVSESLARALELDSSLPEAHLAVAAWKTWHEYDWPAAEAAFVRALELNPSYADAHIFYSHFLSILGRGAEGSAERALAMELDPLNAFYQSLSAVQLAMVGRVDEAIEQLEKTLADSPGIGFARSMLPGLLELQGRLEQALVQKRLVLQEMGDQELVEALDKGAAEGGPRVAMRAIADILAARAQDTYLPAISVAGHYDMAGETGRALEWLDRAWENRDPDLPYIAALGWSKEVTGHPRFQALLQRMNLPPYYEGRSKA